MTAGVRQRVHGRILAVRAWQLWTLPRWLVWFVLAMQCMSTLAVVRRETGGWRWPLFMLAYMNVLAYVACLLVYQVGSRLFH